MARAGLMGGRMHEYPSREALAEALAAGVAAVLGGGIATRGSASLAVSGGSTPRLFLQRLSEASIEWERVEIVLVDERWVPEGDPRSNATFVRENLLRAAAGAARFRPLHRPGFSAREAEGELAKDLAGITRPLDAAILGMGTDGHTASFFPGSPDLSRVLDPACETAVAAVEAPGAPEPRITLTMPLLAEARFLALHIEGEEKRRVLDEASEDGPVEDMPVRAMLRHPRTEALQVFWAP